MTSANDATFPAPIRQCPCRNCARHFFFAQSLISVAEFQIHFDGLSPPSQINKKKKNIILFFNRITNSILLTTHNNAGDKRSVDLWDADAFVFLFFFDGRDLPYFSESCCSANSTKSGNRYG